jgi:hypothetical protein
VLPVDFEQAIQTINHVNDKRGFGMEQSLVLDRDIPCFFSQPVPFAFVGVAVRAEDIVLAHLGESPVRDFRLRASRSCGVAPLASVRTVCRPEGLRGSREFLGRWCSPNVEKKMGTDSFI